MLALVAGGLLLLCLKRNPFDFYLNVWQYGFQNGAWQDSAIRMAPLLLIAAGLTVIFRANIWNLGYDGQFLLGAALVSGYGPVADGPPAEGVRDRRSCSAWPRRSARRGRSSPRS